VKGKRFFIIGLILVIFGLIAYFGYVSFFNPFSPSGKEIRLVIEPNSSVSEVSETLREKGLIASPIIFKFFLKFKQLDRKLIAGEYDLPSGSSLGELIRVLEKGPKRKIYKVTIPEGLTIEQTARLLAQKMKINPWEFTFLAKTRRADFRYDFLASNPSTSLEGYLFPKTYQVFEDISPAQFINILLTQFARETAELDWSFTNKRGLTKHQIVTIASLIEKEAKVAEERKLISAVIYNRLSKGMPLQIDATVQYVLPAWKKKLSTADTLVDSPYNTYLHTGLPPGPIANPGLASIKAALNPAPVDYLYYVLTSPDGRHTFTNSYEEFLRAKEKARDKEGP